MQQPSLSLKSTVTRQQPAFEPVDADERAAQLQYHQAAESAAQAANKAATDTQATEAVPKPRGELQAAFLAGNLGKPITVFTLNGVRLVGRLRQFDQYCLLLEGPAPMLVFKHGISTIAPAR